MLALKFRMKCGREFYRAPRAISSQPATLETLFFLDTIEKYAYRVGDSPLKYNERPSFFATFSFHVEARQ